MLNPMRLTHQIDRPKPRRFMESLTNRRLVPAGQPGGPDWTMQQQADLFASLESGWPIGQFLAWAPAGHTFETVYLLDGLRRAAALSRLTADDDGGLCRDLSAAAPTYVTADKQSADGFYLPVSGILTTMRFLDATANMSKLVRDRGAVVCQPFFDASLDVIVLLGGTPAEVATFCERFIPGRVDQATLDHVTATVYGAATNR